MSKKAAWLLVLDDALFQLPFAALVTGMDKGDPQYLIQRHSLRVLPAAAMLFSRPGLQNASQPKGNFLGVGDPIYNRADHRWIASQRPGSQGGLLSRKTPIGFELSRLPGSGREVVSCARAWSNSTLLVGSDAVRLRIRAALSKGPAAVHFATHVVSHNVQSASGSGQVGESLIAIGLDASGEPDYLTATEIGNFRYNLGVIVLSGCNSGGGEALPGAGLMGLTRAWLLSGARSVAASHWPIADDSGELFSFFYSSFEKRSHGVSAEGAAESLRSAQLKMLNSGTWRSNPKYWAAFFVAGKD